MNYNYPIDTDETFTPWSEEEQKGVEVEVDITLKIHRKVKLFVDDYEKFTEQDDDDSYYQTEYDFSCCDWDKAIEDADILPDGWDIEEQTVEYP